MLSRRVLPRRVLRVVTRLNIGGPARHVLALSRALEADFPSTLAAGQPRLDEGELSDPAVPVVRVPLVRPLQPLTDARALAALRSLLARHPVGIVETHMAKAGMVGRLAALTVAPRPRTIHTFHGHVLEGYFSPVVTKAFLATERAMARHTDVLVAVSPEIRDELVDLGVGRPDQYRVVPVGLDLAPFLTVSGPSGVLRARLGLGPEVPLIGALGRLVPIKDHPTLLRALARLPDAHLALVGDGECRADLEALARDLGVAGRAHFTGWWPEVASALADVDVVALTSRNEGTPVALMEAAAAGRPAVATDVGGVRSVVEHGVTGLLAPPGDVEALAAHLGRLLGDPELRRRMGEAGRAGAQRFGAHRAATAMAELYEELLRPPRPPT